MSSNAISNKRKEINGGENDIADRENISPPMKMTKAAPSKAKKAVTGTTAAKSNKALFETKVKAATEKEAKDFLKVLYKQHPVAVSECSLSMFNPKNMPLVAAPGDPLLSRCFICSTEAGLIPFYDVKQCGSCSAELNEHGGTITRDKVMSYFHFGKAEADKIKRKSSSHGYFNSVIYLYDVKTVVKACQKKYGSLQQMVLKTNMN
eukprot:CAMPEP_0172419924 /NCGR_PEP_ID=MMETSP1064-20121228/6325_1 /TAXON_ID=202472 /ORGANISM="Aulacoseira subarctica , Strain CCAP 1002/5" /LENGTH=205 /DNA_ID=CAMNT_0013159623 /DNA_START=89 /DNA_END=706 /DNA_ORIENTATION=-